MPCGQVAALCSSAPWAARAFWLGEIAASFEWHLGLTGIAAAPLLWLVRLRLLAAAMLLLACVHAGPELFLYLPRSSPSTSTDGPAGTCEVTVACANVLWKNKDHAGFRAWVEEHDPDVIACFEVTPAWREALESLEAEYPFLLLSPEPDTWSARSWGSVVLSRIPFEETRLVPVESKGRWPIEVVIRVGERRVTIRTVHPVRAGKAWRLSIRDAVLDVLSREEWDGAGILIGDLNTTSTSPVFAQLLARSGLSDSRPGFGRQPTFTVKTPIGGLAIAIDQILVGEDLRVVERETTQLAGSDHLAVIARLALAGPTMRASATDSAGER